MGRRLAVPLQSFVLAVALSAALLAAAPRGAADEGTGGAPASPSAPEVPTKDLVAKLAESGNAAADELVRRGAAAVPDLVAGLADVKLRPGIAAVIERIGPPAKDAVPALTGVVKGAASPARPQVMRALAAIGADAVPAVPALTGVVSFKRAKDRVEAMASLERILVLTARSAPRPTTPTIVDRAIGAGCRWLLRHQSPEGHWACERFDETCTGARRCGGRGRGEFDVGVTSLAALALLGAPEVADGAKATDAALARIVDSQAGNGVFGPPGILHHGYNTAAGTLALAEAVARHGRPELRASLVRAVAWIHGARNPYLAWRYKPRGGDNDTSITVWMTRALTRAEEAGVVGPPSEDDWRLGPRAWIDKMTDGEKGRVGYQQRGGPSARTQEMVEQFPASEVESMTACGLLTRLTLGGTRGDPLVELGIGLLRERRPRWDASGRAVDFYYWMHGSEVMRIAGRGDYVAWRNALIVALLPHQIPDGPGCEGGSWPADDPWAVEAGRVYSTAAALLALESCREDPASRPPLAGSAKAAVDALDKAAADEEPAVRDAAQRALMGIRGAYRN